MIVLYLMGAAVVDTNNERASGEKADLHLSRVQDSRETRNFIHNGTLDEFRNRYVATDKRTG